MLFNIIFLSNFYIIKNNKISLFIFKFFLFFNVFFFFLFNYNILFSHNEIYIYIILLLILFFSCEKTIYIIFICIFMKNDNLLINLAVLEILNLIFFTQCHKNNKDLKNIIIHNYFLSTAFILVSTIFFFFNYSTLNKITLSYFDLYNLQNFIMVFIFLKMGGIVGHKLNIYFYKNLNYKDLILYTITNLYLYFYFFNIENLFLVKKTNIYLILFLIITNYLLFIFNFEKFKNKRDFLFFSSQMILTNIFFLIFL